MKTTSRPAAGALENWLRICFKLYLVMHLFWLRGRFFLGEKMGRSKNRRINARRRYLAGLARENPVKFSREWGKRLQSRRDYIFQESRSGNANTALAAVFDSVADDLSACPKKIRDREIESSIKALKLACSQAIASSADPRMMKLSNFQRILNLSKLGFRGR